MLYYPKWKVILVIGVCLLGLLLAAPNLLSHQEAEALPNWLPKKQISLGLDLQGGSHLLLEVDTDAVVRELMEALVDSVRAELREARIRYTGLGVQGSSVAVTILDQDRLEEARRLLRDLGRDTVVSGGDGSRLTLRMTEEAVRQRKASAVEKSVEIIRRRVDETGVREPTIQPQGEDRILLQLPGISDPERMKSLLGKTAKMTFHLLESRASEAAGGRVPAGAELLPAASETDTQRTYLVRKRVVVSGENLVDAQPTFDPQTNEPIVSFRFDTAGGKRFGDATSNNVGEFLAIVLDGKVISAPRIREPILGGSGIISGNFTVEEAKDLALLLRAGALPAPLTIVEERTVGPDLGADSIAAGKVAGVVGFVLVAGFMVVAYGLFGIIANIALVFNLILIAAAMSVLQATLTLPGIAGIVLTMGMAVDANVLIFERMREELRVGRTPISAIDAGYARALSAIIDGNVTTLFAAVLLYMFGAGPVRGFAVTLSIGIIASMFTAITLTRLCIIAWLGRSRPRALPI